MPIRLPDETKRLAIVGATGSGKTIAELWHLSMRDYDSRPWIIYNFKDDENIDSIPYAQPMAIDEMPTKPGIYIVKPLPGQKDELEAQMWEVWRRGGIGVAIDEGYMIGTRNEAFRALLTQGRSKRIPMIVLSQRPVWMDKFVFTESEFYQVFRLQNSDDNKIVEKFVPADLSARLPEFHSYYYAVGCYKLTRLSPVPDMEQINETFDARLRTLKRTV